MTKETTSEHEIAITPDQIRELSQQIKDAINSFLQQRQEKSLPEQIVVHQDQRGTIFIERYLLGDKDDDFSSKDLALLSISTDPQTKDIQLRVSRNIKMNSVIRYGSHKKITRNQWITITISQPEKLSFKKAQYKIRADDTEIEHTPGYYDHTVEIGVDTAEKVQELLTQVLDQFNHPTPLYQIPT